ncbi:hypothetical protein BB559_000355 [Furculomyces boomerangus]|uniref:ATP phosphoribosyltransferase n=2 Tax=Harpellales TaxID=61421 RepID=A0A2T9Z5N2_9FUNG|nr:hypothetical protein BB559_000355 [Furculomyces boomerangus]PWA01663.1 hypothetical protein BB558_002230 [Smittium angustum]
MNQKENRMILAVPKKGRLYEECLQLLHKIGIDFYRKPRQDITLVTNLPILLVFLPAADIATYVAKGSVDMGMTGYDIIAENNVDDKVDTLLNLGFGKCKLQVQVPVESNASGGSDLIGKRVVTSFPNLTRKYFAELEGVKEDEIKTKIQYVNGSVEAACGLGLADGIVDLVESGDTMRAAGLRVAGTLLQTETKLITNQHSSHRQLIETLKSRIEGVLTAKLYVLCQYNIHREKTGEAIKITPGKRAPSIMTLDNQDWVAINAMVEKSNLAEKMDSLKAIGATDILVLSIENCRV